LSPLIAVCLDCFWGRSFFIIVLYYAGLCFDYVQMMLQTKKKWACAAFV
jgi:hypothetical protein